MQTKFRLVSRSGWVAIVMLIILFLFSLVGQARSEDLPTNVLPSEAVAADWQGASEEIKRATAEFLAAGDVQLTPDLVYDYFDQFYKEFPGDKFQVSIGNLFKWLTLRIGPPAITEPDAPNPLKNGREAIWEI